MPTRRSRRPSQSNSIRGGLRRSSRARPMILCRLTYPPPSFARGVRPSSCSSSQPSPHSTSATRTARVRRSRACNRARSAAASARGMRGRGIGCSLRVNLLIRCHYSANSLDDSGHCRVTEGAEDMNPVEPVPRGSTLHCWMVSSRARILISHQN